MLLAIDAGNTNIVFAIHDGTQLRGEWRSASQDLRTADEYIVWLTQLMQLDGLTINDIDSAIIATVVPQALTSLQQLCRRYVKCEPLIVGAKDVVLGIDVDVDRRSEVGADRLVNAVGSHGTYGGPSIVVDFGTATTFDVVDADGTYRGGIIAPGINLSVRALHMAAARLPNIGIDRPRSVIGKNTVDAMQSGVYWGYVSLIEGLVARVVAEFGKPMKVIATGGLAPLFETGTDAIDVVDPDLTIRGLVEIFKRNH